MSFVVWLEIQYSHLLTAEMTFYVKTLTPLMDYLQCFHTLSKRIEGSLFVVLLYYDILVTLY